MAAPTKPGAVGSLWRYPVKSMRGEELKVVQMKERGLCGDRAYALVDRSDGKVATAKNPRKWPNLFDFRASFIDPTLAGTQVAPICITLPDGTLVTSEQTDCSHILSRALGREVTLEAVMCGDSGTTTSSTARAANAEEYWPDIEGLEHRDTVTDFALPKGTFFDCATIHLVTTATLNQLRDFYPKGGFEIQRFRPNIVVDIGEEVKGFIENAWIGHTLTIGNEVRLRITGPCGRCVMTTLAQGKLQTDSGILRTAVRRNQGNVGVYAAVERGGTIRRGDEVRLAA